MFGYVRPYRPSVTLGDYEFYRSVYCGICRAMKRQTGQISSMTLNYDMVFLALARIIVGGRTISIHPHRCAVHPLKPRAMVVDNPATDASSVKCRPRRRKPCSPERKSAPGSPLSTAGLKRA